MHRTLVAALASLCVGACASSPPDLPYPAFIQADELPDIFIAGLPGIRAKRFAGSADTRRSSNLLTLPADWSFSTGGMPDKSVEIYVLSGAIVLGDLTLRAGGYAFLPSGTTGVSLKSEAGAQILYFLDDANPASVIRTPLISGRDILAWRPVSAEVEDFGLSVKELRADPGSGARTWLLRIDRGASLPWQSLSVMEEGFMLEGTYRHSECADGVPVTATYTRGGYYLRPADRLNGGPDSAAVEPAVWLLRTLSAGVTSRAAACSPPT